MKYALIIVSVALLIQCKAKKSNTAETVIYLPSEKELAIAQKTWPNCTAEELKEGNSIFRNQCTNCHRNYEITGFSEKKWKHEIDDMAPKAHLTAEQKEKLSKFILSYREANTVVAPK